MAPVVDSFITRGQGSQGYFGLLVSVFLEKEKAKEWTLSTGNLYKLGVATEKHTEKSCLTNLSPG